MRFDPIAGMFRTYEGGGKGGTPAPPDYVGAANAQGASSKENIALQTAANRPHMVTPWGDMSWTSTGGTDPGLGTPITNWQGKLTLNPQEQAALDSQQNVTKGRSQAAETLLGQATGAFQTPAEWDKLPGLQTIRSEGYNPNSGYEDAKSALYEQQMQNIEPMLTQSENTQRARLANMGISPEGSSEAWSRAQTGMNKAREQAYRNASLASITGATQQQQSRLAMASGAAGSDNQARQQAIAEMSQRRGMPLNELNALLTQQQVQQPNMPSFTPASAAPPTPFLGAAQSLGDYNLNAAKINQGGGSDWGTLLGTAAGAYLGSPAGGAAVGGLFK